MKRKILFIIITLALSSCLMKKRSSFTEGETILAHGIIIEEANDFKQRYFIACHQIIDTVNILENLRFESNVAAGIVLYKSYSEVIEFMMKDNKWSTYTLRDGIIINAVIVEISYTKMHNPNLILDVFTELFCSELYLDDDVVNIYVDGNLYRINFINSLK